MRPRLDRRRTVIPLLAVATLVLGFGLSRLDGNVGTGTSSSAAAPGTTQAVAPMSADDRLLHQRFQQAVVLLQHDEFEAAMQGFHEVLRMAPDMPEAHVNMGYALLGAGEFEAARSFFDTASNLRPGQANAYYGMAIAWEGLGELGMARATMQAYLHVAEDNDPYRRKAESAIWEWEAALAARNDEKKND